MLELLKKIEPKRLQQIIGKERVRKIYGILSDESFEIDLVAIANAIYGDSILENSRLRKEIIKLLPTETLQKLSKKYCGKSYASKESAAIQLTSKPWSTANKLPYELIRYLGISMKYLPRRISRLNTVEIVHPTSKYHSLFEYQKNIQEEIVNKLENNISRFIVQMPTGSGKTKTCLEAVIEYSSRKNIFENERSIVWIAHTEELCEQAISSLSTIWQNTQEEPLKIIRFWGNYTPTEDELHGSFIFTSYQKMCSNKSSLYLSVLSYAAKVVVIDEAHKALAPTYSKMINDLCINKACLVGLTATPGRSSTDNISNSQFAQFFNKQIITPDFDRNAIVVLQEKKVLSKVIHETIESHIELDSPEDKQMLEQPDYTSKQLSYLGTNSKRNRLIVDIITNEVENENPSLVFTCSVEHSVILTSTLRFLGVRAAYVDSSIKKTLRRKIIADFKDEKYDVLLNFGVLTTGFDAPRIKTVIISRPTTSIVLYSQMIGRGLRGRKVGGNDTSKIIDIKDNFRDFGVAEDIYDYFSGYWS